MREESDVLAAAAEAAMPGWVVRSAERVLVAWAGHADPTVLAEAEAAGEAAQAEVRRELRALLALDIDEQRANPLSVLRAAVRHPTEVLRRAGVPPVVRDEFDERHFPNDDYGLTPMSFAEVDPVLHEAGIRWGAAKAQLHRARHRGSPR